jgi:hypothetical protein
VLKFEYISAEAALLVPGEGPFAEPWRNGKAKESETHIYLDIYIRFSCKYYYHVIVIIFLLKKWAVAVRCIIGLDGLKKVRL